MIPIKHFYQSRATMMLSPRWDTCMRGKHKRVMLIVLEKRVVATSEGGVINIWVYIRNISSSMRIKLSKSRHFQMWCFAKTIKTNSHGNELQMFEKLWLIMVWCFWIAMEYFQHSMPCPHEKTHKNFPLSLPIQISQPEVAKDFYTCAQQFEWPKVIQYRTL